MLTGKEIVLELESIQRIVAPDYACKKSTLREILDSLRITIQYLKLDNESLQREKNALKKK